MWERCFEDGNVVTFYCNCKFLQFVCSELVHGSDVTVYFKKRGTEQMCPFVGFKVENDSKREQSLMDVRGCVLTKWSHLFIWSFL